MCCCSHKAVRGWCEDNNSAIRATPKSGRQPHLMRYTETDCHVTIVQSFSRVRSGLHHRYSDNRLTKQPTLIPSDTGLLCQTVQLTATLLHSTADLTDRLQYIAAMQAISLCTVSIMQIVYKGASWFCGLHT